MEGEGLRKVEVMVSPPRLCFVKRQWNDFEGVGLKIIGQHNTVSIHDVRQLSPGHRAGLKPGDIIIEIDGENVEGLALQEVTAKFRSCGDEFHILVADKASYDHYKEEGVALSSTMSGLKVMPTTAKPYTFDDTMLLLEKKVKTFMASTSPRKKYLAEVVLRVPLMFVIHFLLVLSPSSNYTLVECVLLILKYIAAFLAYGTWGLPWHTLFKLYCSMFMNMFISWMMEKMYWTFQNEAVGACHDIWLPWGEDSWWIPALVTLILQASHLLYLFKLCEVKSSLRLPLCTALLLPYNLCMFNVGLYYISSFLYVLYKGIFGLVLLVEMCKGFSTVLDKQGNFKLPPIPGAWFSRDINAMFCVIYYTCCVVFDLIFVHNVSYILSVPYLTASVGLWCTSFAIVVSLGALFGVVANCAAALSLWLVKGEMDILAVMNSPLGNRVNITMATYCIEAGILTSSEETRILSMESVLFLSLYVIVLQAWDLTESHLLFVVNSGERRQWVPYIRVALYSVLLLTVPTCITILISPKIEVDFWLMLNLSGNISLIVRAVVVAMEIALVAITWHVDNGLDKLEDAIYYVKVGKTVLTVICNAMLGYYRFHAPFFHTWFVTRAIMIVSDVSIGTFGVCKKEWDLFRLRRLHLKRVNEIPAASADDIREYDDVCSVCYASITDGKKLPCAHLFHSNCLRKWFQIRTSCPMCNANIINN